MINCFRCCGRKKLYKKGSGYMLCDSGGVLVDCPLCLGVGKIKELEHSFAEVKETVENLIKETEKETKKNKKKPKSLELYDDIAS